MSKKASDSRYNDPMVYWHQLTEDEVFQRIGSDAECGLSAQEVEHRLAQDGPNVITGQAMMPAWRRMLLQFHNPLIYILLVAILVTMLLGEYVDAGVILLVVVVNALIGFAQESKAEQAIHSLKKMLSSNTTVIRDGKKQSIPTIELVCGDIVLFASGDKVPADTRLYRCRDLQVDESTLTGESVAVQKQPGQLDAETVLGDRHNMVFAGTLVTYGTAQGIVVATGDKTQTGKIARMIAQAIQLETPLTRKIHAFSRLLLWVILVLAAVTFFIGLGYGLSVSDTFMAAVALAVAAIPEGLPAVVTITLAIGVRRMARRNAIIRKLSAVETLGSTNVICSDKTGTLTENQMTVQGLYAGEDRIEVSGSGYAPYGELDEGWKGNCAFEHLLRAGLLNNDSRLLEKNERWFVEGDPTEGALITCALKAGFETHDSQQCYPRLDTIPFESDRQYMATLHHFDDDRNIIYLKGSVEQISRRCRQQLTAEGHLTAFNLTQVNEQVTQWASQGLRVLAFAMQWVDKEEKNLQRFNHQEAEKNLVFIGLQAMIDPPRSEAIHAVEICQKAGVKVKMITGDHALTAQAIASKIGIISAPDSRFGSVLTGQQLNELNDEEFKLACHEVSIFARVAPEQKLQLVTALQAHQWVVAMTGDGVNDAPALKQADIGIAMGISGTEVAKEASDMVLTDDNFSSIEAAVEEGRNVFDNLTKFITWILPTNLGQGLVIMVAIVFGLTLPILPVQALWLNMTTAVFLGLMLAFEPKEVGLMQRRPRQLKEPILNREIISRILSVSSLLLLGAFGLFQWSVFQGASLDESRSIAVTLFVVVQSFFLLNCRRLNGSIFTMPLHTNPWIMVGLFAMFSAQLAFLYLPVMNQLFHSAPISLMQWGVMILYGFIVMILIEIEKMIWRKHKQQKRG
ncbi:MULTISPECIES: cation-transporting P-type ATPase [unclassified Vibrio]|uniref:cation-translocating P-type ATPase n=1 Tax=unclassified Vibrio TaxID=2614977 RepID=UPI0014834DC0|nr:MULTISPECIES: cation-transporting P-type ATPase [unclassified Vibrio]NNN44948.1 cation-transporting P-type ATPase [Vibrio sp. 1-1(7)]NNN72321.1 cation-transporting P-type ATPase [Vibrio sp. 12-2(3-a)]